jgi:predicted RNA-binding protein Jag
VRDRVFSGPDVEEALAVAAASLGLPRAELRYVVLDAGAPGGRGLQPTPARIAVLVQEAGPPPEPAGEREQPPAAAPADARARLRETIRAVAEAGASRWRRR